MEGAVEVVEGECETDPNLKRQTLVSITVGSFSLLLSYVASHTCRCVAVTKPQRQTFQKSLWHEGKTNSRCIISRVFEPSLLALYLIFFPPS
jgi:hypothetical protein